MITVLHNSTDPFYNQAFEEFVFENFRDDPVFLLWQNTPAVIVGCSQNICRETSVPTLRRLGIPVVRRMTGGGTVYHDLGNLNYSLMLPSDGSSGYDDCLSFIVSALNDIGVPARRSRICDLAIGDGKISGSAQRVSRGRVLHHGTLLFSSDLGRLNRLTADGKNDCFRTKGTLSDVCRVVNISDFLPPSVTLDVFRSRLLDRALPPGSPRLTLTPAQNAEVCRLRDEKYRGWDWTWGRTPAFTYEKSGLLGGQPAAVTYQAKQGVVSGFRLDCPLVSAEDAALLFNGAHLDPDGFERACRLLAPEYPFELFELLM